MPYEWDENKSDKNRRERGFGFEVMEDFDWSLALLGPINETLYAVVITRRNANDRIISLRKAERTDITKWRREFYND